VLANLLPGFRHTRTPLVAGSLWLLIAWLLFGHRLLPDAEGGRIEGLLHDLGSMVGTAVPLAGLALLATLIGGVIPAFPVRMIARRLPINKGGRWWQTASCRLFGVEPDLAHAEGAFNHWLYRRASLVADSLEWGQFKGRDCPPVLQVAARDLCENGFARVGRQQLRNSDFVGEDAPTPQTWLAHGLAAASIRTEVDDGELALQLQIEHESLFNAYDRIRAESELRAALVIPLVILISVLTTTSALWVVALILPGWLLTRAVQADIEAEQMLLRAVRHGLIRSSTIAFVESVDEASGATDPA